jgi:hypothetical protein
MKENGIWRVSGFSNPADGLIDGSGYPLIVDTEPTLDIAKWLLA